MANANQADQDSDGVGNECDDDLDGDDVPNVDDNCVYGFNPGQEDQDGDGTGDICEGGAAQAGGCNCRTTADGSVPLKGVPLWIIGVLLWGFWRRRRR